MPVATVETPFQGSEFFPSPARANGYEPCRTRLYFEWFLLVSSMTARSGLGLGTHCDLFGILVPLAGAGRVKGDAAIGVVAPR